MNSQLFGSGLVLEDEQWASLEREANERIGARPVIVFMHEATHRRPESASSDNWMSIPRFASERLVRILRRLNLQLVATGHTHRYLE